MGQKVHPYGFRLGFNRTWHSRWFSEKDYLKYLHEDLKLRKELKGRLSHAGVSEIDIERFSGKLKVNIQTSRPGIIIGKRGAEVDRLRDELQKRTGTEVHINIIEIQRPETDAQLVAESIALQLERRVAFRRAMKKGIESAFRFGAQGIKIRCAGRLNGAEIARSEWYQGGYTHTSRPTSTTASRGHFTGKIGVKVWIYRGEQHKAKNRRKTAA
jgi:small subunit ribosomal protein S3